jgi:hypothetical protein
MPNRRQFHKLVYSYASGLASSRAKYPARGQRRRNALGHYGFSQIFTGFHRLCHRGESAT